jgi:hypothetical protein
MQVAARRIAKEMIPCANSKLVPFPLFCPRSEVGSAEMRDMYIVEKTSELQQKVVPFRCKECLVSPNESSFHSFLSTIDQGACTPFLLLLLVLHILHAQHDLPSYSFRSRSVLPMGPTLLVHNFERRLFHLRSVFVAKQEPPVASLILKE